MIIYGHRLYGKVDAVPGVGHVATKFLHIDYVPLIPTECWLVTEQTGRNWRGVKIPFSLKSIVAAWGRAVSLAVGLVATVAAVATGFGSKHQVSFALEAGTVAAVAWAVFAFTYKHRLFARASYARACQLADLMKMDDAGRASLCAAYGQPPPRGFEPVVSATPPPVVAIVEDTHPPADGFQEASPPPPPTAVTAQQPLRGY